jgi:hypothetical protein
MSWLVAVRLDDEKERLRGPITQVGCAAFNECIGLQSPCEDVSIDRLEADLAILMQRSPKCLQPIGNRPTLLRSPEDENKKAKGEDSPFFRSCPVGPESCICSGIAAGKPRKDHQDKAKYTRDSRQYPARSARPMASSPYATSKATTVAQCARIAAKRGRTNGMRCR